MSTTAARFGMIEEIYASDMPAMQKKLKIMEMLALYNDDYDLYDQAEDILFDLSQDIKKENDNFIAKGMAFGLIKEGDEDWRADLIPLAEKIKQEAIEEQRKKDEEKKAQQKEVESSNCCNLI